VVEGESAANIIRSHPDYENRIDPKWRTAASDCQHCGVRRTRLKTFILEHESGEVIQVGSTCIGDFLGSGLNPEYLAAYEEEFFALTSERWSEEGESGGGGSSVLDTTKMLEAAVTHIRIEGWISRKMARASIDGKLVPTATRVECWLLFRSSRATIQQIQDWNEMLPSIEDCAKAEKVREWTRTINADNDYLHNLKTVAQMEVLSWRHLGIGVSMVAAYDKAIGEAVERQRRAQTSKHFGEVGKRGTWVVTVSRIGSVESQYGLTHIVGMLTSEGNEATWFASRKPDVNVGDVVQVTGSVKKHDQYKGVSQTMLTRCKISKAAE
jgi:hypothetical protein